MLSTDITRAHRSAIGCGKEVTRGLKPRSCFTYEGVSMFFHEQIMFLNHSSGKSFNVEATLLMISDAPYGIQGPSCGYMNGVVYKWKI